MLILRCIKSWIVFRERGFDVDDLTLYQITKSGNPYTFQEIKKAINKAIKKEDDGCYSWLFLNNLRAFNLRYLCKGTQLDRNKKYRLFIRYCDLEIVEE